MKYEWNGRYLFFTVLANCARHLVTCHHKYVLKQYTAIKDDFSWKCHPCPEIFTVKTQFYFNICLTTRHNMNRKCIFWHYRHIYTNYYGQSKRLCNNINLRRNTGACAKKVLLGTKYEEQVKCTPCIWVLTKLATLNTLP